MANVEVYSGDFCPYCVRAKKLLEKKGVKYAEYNIKRELPRQVEMLERTGGARTIPQIFINDRHIGGCDDLYALESRGQLDPLLES